MSFWLCKIEPRTYTWEQLEADGEIIWKGVRHYQARKFLSEMRKGDRLLIYHAGDEKAVRGIAEVTEEAFPDPLAETGNRLAVRIKPIKPLTRVLQLEEIRNTYGLNVMPVVSQTRLSVHPVTKSQWRDIMKYTKTDE